MRPPRTVVCHDPVAYDGIMSEPLVRRLREERLRRGWSQEELAARAGLSRAAVSAAETGRAVPSAAAALALARALDRRVEDLFALPGADEPAWAWEPGEERRFWLARLDGALLRYPVEATAAGVVAHDGAAGGPPVRRPPDPASTLVLAGCDPAGGLLAAAAAERGVRALPLLRSSGRALELLRRGRVHAAGLHLAADPEENAVLARRLLGDGYRLLHVARWSEGVALAPGTGVHSVEGVARAALRWVGREEGSGARACQDVVLGGRAGSAEGIDRVAPDHRAVADVLRSGFAQAGVCVRLAARERGLDFLPVRTEAYDLCFPAELEDDPRMEALVDAVRSRGFREAVAALPGYDARATGALQ